MSSKAVLVLGDIHWPWPHKQALHKLRTQVIPAVKPHTIVQIGDLLDLYGLSRFSKDPGRGLTLKQEAQLGHEFYAAECALRLCEPRRRNRLARRQRLVR